MEKFRGDLDDILSQFSASISEEEVIASSLMPHSWGGKGNKKNSHTFPLQVVRNNFKFFFTFLFPTFSTAHSVTSHVGLCRCSCGVNTFRAAYYQIHESPDVNW